LKHCSTTEASAVRSASARFALTGVALAAACLWGSQAHALGLGRLNVQSALGEPLRAEIEVTAITPEEASSLKLRIASPDTYRAQGVDYNAVLSNAQVQLQRRPDGRSVLRVSSDRAVLEPFVDVIVEASWASGRLMRDYTMLFDPPTTRTAQAPATSAMATPAPATSAMPSGAAAPVAQPGPTPAPATAVAPAARTPRPATPPRATAAALPPPAASAEGANEYRVRPGDSLSRIAGQVRSQGVSLDQMLVSLFRANPQAFMGENMNRLRAGVVLSVPSAEDAAKVTQQQARELIVAQSADFAAYRQRLAGGTTATAESQPPRQASGRVQAQVEERKPTAAAPDKLTLSQGGIKPGAPEAQASKASEQRAQTARIDELNRNVEELKKLQQGAATAPAGPAPAPAPAVAAAPAPSAPVPSVALAPAPAAVPSAPAAGPTPAPASAAKPQPAPVKPAPAAEPGWLDSVLENPLLLPGAGVLVALLAGLGLYRLRGRMRKGGGETSFLESRMQPDSFFGASGGQRVDTREAASSQSSSSMSYSLSQLDAIGDVDPVAEADVYLAYGRDLQAEEILKEAMRANPERMAIRTKLLEVYAKRRDAKGFELLATQVHNLTRGEGEDWAKAQQLGIGIDPGNPLYQPGGRPEAVIGGSGQPVEPLGASTVPYTAPVTAPTFQPAADATLDHGVDLDLDIAGVGGTGPAHHDHEATQPIATAASALDFELDAPTIPVAEPRTLEQQAPAHDASALDFDLGDLGAAATASAAAAAPAADFGDFMIGGEPAPSTLPGDADPLERKLELAEEFRQIGDLEGARDLLEEVVAKAEGALRVKAQGMLEALG